MNLQEQIYKDFIDIVLPRISEWFTMTKDYAFDLWWRYIKYIIITDLIDLVLATVFLGISIIWYIKWKEDMKFEDNLLLLIPIFFIVLAILIWVYNFNSLVGSMIVPEIRIYDGIQSIKNINK